MLHATTNYFNSPLQQAVYKILAVVIIDLYLLTSKQGELPPAPFIFAYDTILY